MATPTLESTLGILTQVNKIGFTEFTTDLVRNVYNTIVQASMEQLKSYAEFVKEVSGDLNSYYAANGLTGTALTNNSIKYANEVLGLTSGATTNDPYTYAGSSPVDATAKKDAIIAELQGIDTDDNAANDPAGTIQNPAVWSSSGGNTLTINSALLNSIIAKKLQSGAKDSYDILTTVLKIGMQKIVVNNGRIATKLTFHVDANDSVTRASSNISNKAAGFNLGGSAGKGFMAKVGGGWALGGSYANTKLNVTVINETSSAIANMKADIVGEVEILFSTQTFPSIS